MSDLLRIDKFVPYVTGEAWILKTWDAGYRRARGMFDRAYVRYELAGPDGAVIFEGSEYSPSPMVASDSDAAVADLMGFLTLRPGDTDREHFEDYTPAQMQFAREHAEMLGSLLCEGEDGEPPEPDGDCWVRVE